MNNKTYFENLFNTQLNVINWSNGPKVKAYFTKKIKKMTFERTIKNSTNFFLPKQIHGDEILRLKEPLEPFSVEADAVITDRDVFVGVRTADCVPILLATKDNRFVGAVHAGWKGSLKKILAKTIRELKSLKCTPEEIFLAIGPHIRECCYEVKDDLIKILKKVFPENYENFLRFKKNKVFLSLLEINLFQAISEGVPKENIVILKECTCCNLEYASFRRDKSLDAFQLSFIKCLR